MTGKLCLSLLLAVSLLPGCSKSEEPARPAAPSAPAERTPAPPSGDDAPAKPAPVPATPPAGAGDQQPGAVSGQAKWEGSILSRKPVPVQADPHCATLHANAPLLSERLIINDNSTVRNVFVYVKSGLPAGRDWPVPDEPVVLDQKGCQYEPHVFGIRAGQDLLIRNSDNTAHNINASPQANTGFNLGQPKKGMETTRRFERREVMVPIKCDVHPWMSAYCAVLDHPFFAVSDEAGRFEINDLPPGTYVLEAWHEHKGLKPQTTELTVKSGQTTTVEFVFSRP